MVICFNSCLVDDELDVPSGAWIPADGTRRVADPRLNQSEINLQRIRRMQKSFWTSPAGVQKREIDKINSQIEQKLSRKKLAL